MVTTMVEGTTDFPIGAPVYTADGVELGKVVSATAHLLVVERGWFVRHGYTFRHADVDHYQDGALVLRLSSGEIDERFGS